MYLSLLKFNKRKCINALLYAITLTCLIIYIYDFIFLITDNCSTICSQKWCSYSTINNVEISLIINKVIFLKYMLDDKIYNCVLHHNTQNYNLHDVINIAYLKSDNNVCVPISYAVEFKNHQILLYSVYMCVFAIVYTLLFLITHYYNNKKNNAVVLPLNETPKELNKTYPICDDIEAQIIKVPILTNVDDSNFYSSNNIESNLSLSEFDKFSDEQENQNDDNIYNICNNLINDIINDIIKKNNNN